MQSEHVQLPRNVQAAAGSTRIWLTLSRIFRIALRVTPMVPTSSIGCSTNELRRSRFVLGEGPGDRFG